MLKLITFLGNPGIEHLQTRHNIGWMLAKHLSLGDWQKKFKGQYSQATFSGNKYTFLKPETFMNLSGESVLAALQFFKIQPNELLVVHDDLELDFGYISFKKGGGLGGHNGLRSIAGSVGTPDFFRFRLGISRPAHGNISAYVLSRFSGTEQLFLSEFLQKAAVIFQKIYSDEIETLVKLYPKEKLIHFSK